MSSTNSSLSASMEDEEGWSDDYLHTDTNSVDSKEDIAVEGNSSNNGENQLNSSVESSNSEYKAAIGCGASRAYRILSPEPYRVLLGHTVRSRALIART